MRWEGNIALIMEGRREVHTRFWWGDLREGDHLEDPDVDRRVIFKWIFKKWDGACTGLICSG
jgi:hypothetical protein